MDKLATAFTHLKAKISANEADDMKEVVYESLRASSDSSEKLLPDPGSDIDSLRVEVSKIRSRSRLSRVTLASLLALVSLCWAAREFSAWKWAARSKVHGYAGDKVEYVYGKIPDVFSPAIEAVEYKEVVFHNNFHEDRTKWQGPPSDEVDKAWRDIYVDIGVIKIPKVDAERLPNHTLPIPGEEDGYITGLEVYHQLHCLDLLRKHLYPDRYGADHGMSPDGKREYWIHLEHCIDNLRQTIMCYSDISTIPWKFHERVQAEFPDAHTTHVCRDFDKLTEWMLHPDRHFPQEEYQLRLEAFHAGAVQRY